MTNERRDGARVREINENKVNVGDVVKSFGKKKRRWEYMRRIETQTISILHRRRNALFNFARGHVMITLSMKIFMNSSEVREKRALIADHVGCLPA